MEPYVPEELPLKDLDYGRLLGLVGQANAELARYDGLLQGIVNPAVLLSPLTTQEAVLSSKIEGTQATVDEVLEHEAGIKQEGEKYKDIQEIINYRTAMMKARDHVAEYPITLSLIREIHKILLDSVRGQDKNPGEFRKEQNWIGTYGTPIEQARFVPPSHFVLSDHLNLFEEYMGSDDADHLLQTAVVHAQFELIHPFKDGNGRIGRILIPLFLYRKKKLSAPMFYLSSYFERNRELYYDKLRRISREKDWNGWIEFFLEAVSTQALENSQKVKTIMNLYEEMKESITSLTHSQYAVQVLDAIFDKPLFRTSDFVQRTSIHKATAMGLLRRLKDAEILREFLPASGRRAAVLFFPELLNIIEGKTLFSA